MVADDSSLPIEDLEEIARIARRALNDADAIGVFPTPVDRIMEAAKIQVVPLAIDEGYLARLRRQAEAAGKALLSAISKVWGVLDPKARVAFIDPETPKAKLPFLKLHEGGHALLPWQSLFGHVEDCRKTLSPEIKDEFEQQANVFASDVLFQMGSLRRDAGDLSFGIPAILSLAKRYGASIYATARRYAQNSDRTCAVIFLDPPAIHAELGGVAMVRRVATSSSFDARFSHLVWPSWISTREGLGRLIPLAKMTRPRDFSMADANSDRFEFVGEAFRTTHHIMILISCLETTVPKIFVPDRQLVLF
ncbi:hypothetical protein [Sphingomonas abietis]|uniref:ImmA/IrrE family metallo-endopeptidase n=1 Tax=Sphingomonas abietis TaxID=3012344 RepID=A0ABY7NMH1_9SPHN|nr:hypothetical protein [Sphingomonas abietis]WBO22721.1 hypothetical protein PBT88_00765 [Sphingomonas abietis]